MVFMVDKSVINEDLTRLRKEIQSQTNFLASVHCLGTSFELLHNLQHLGSLGTVPSCITIIPNLEGTKPEKRHAIINDKVMKLLHHLEFEVNAVNLDVYLEAEKFKTIAQVVKQKQKN